METTPRNLEIRCELAQLAPHEAVKLSIMNTDDYTLIHHFKTWERALYDFQGGSEIGAILDAIDNDLKNDPMQILFDIEWEKGIKN